MSTDTPREPRVLTGIGLLVTVSSVIVLFAIMLYTVANVINRTIVGTPLPAVIELITRWWMVPLVFGGWLIAHLADEHIRVDFIAERATGIVAPLHQLLNKLLLLAFLALIAVGGWIGATENRLRDEHGIDTGAPIWISRYAVPLMTAALILFVVYEIATLALRIARRRGDTHSHSPSTPEAPTDDVDIRHPAPGVDSGPSQIDSRTGAHHDNA